MSGLQDGRVLQAFLQGVQRAYMLSVEQRLTGSNEITSRLTGSSSGLARLNHVSVTKTSDFSTTSSTAVDVTGLALDIETYGGDLLVIASAQVFYVSIGSGGATGEFGFSVDGGPDQWVWQHEVATTDNDGYGLSAVRLFSVSPGGHRIKGRAKTNAGTLRLYAGTTYPSFMVAIEI